MSSVTERIKQIKQPYGGYVNPSSLTETFSCGNHGIIPLESENIPAATIGMVVDYMTRYTMGAEKQNAFHVSLTGAARATAMTGGHMSKTASEYFNNINGLDNRSIINACHLVGFDVWLRNVPAAMAAWQTAHGQIKSQTEPDTITCDHIRAMVTRSVNFWRIYGPITKDGFTFEPTGYTKTIDRGDGDYLTIDTLWDFKVSKNKPSAAHTLQLLIYWIMGQHSGQSVYKSITKLGLFNPRLNTIYQLNISDIPSDTIEAIEKDVICY